jgi:hypothetical protein
MAPNDSRSSALVCRRPANFARMEQGQAAAAVSDTSRLARRPGEIVTREELRGNGPRTRSSISITASTLPSSGSVMRSANRPKTITLKPCSPRISLQCAGQSVPAGTSVPAGSARVSQHLPLSLGFGCWRWIRWCALTWGLCMGRPSSSRRFGVKRVDRSLYFHSENLSRDPEQEYFPTALPAH